ncbi:curlin, partial [Shigella sonnei]|nr:curlin [Shigella sonnei]EKD5660848.1 curlin [Shigella sonnei]EMA6714491.1 curlin [Shigella sonnei]MMD04903.1 curlin [Shigella sonnei]
MKLLKVAAIAAIVFSGSALAGVVPQYGGGNHGGGGNNSGPNSELNIYQYGGGNSALVLQTDARNSDLTI